MYKLTRGIRNKNPGNIRFSLSNDWLGQVGQDEAGFCKFSDDVYGIRAIARTIKSYQRRGVLSVRQIISTWAPANENDTESYIRSVVKRMDVPGGDFIPYAAEGDYPDLIKAIIYHENGTQPYSDELINQAIGMA